MVILCYHIRTQGVALFAAVVLFFLCTKKWKEAASTVAGFIIGCLPWIWRNKSLGIGQSRYFESIAQVNPWRPEDGSLDLSGIIDRFFETLGMLVSKALPNSVIPYFKVNYSAEVSAGFFMWIIAILLIFLIIRGFWAFGKYRWVLIGYTVFTFGLVSIFSTPSENRYITTLIPFMNMGLLVGIYAVATDTIHRFKLKYTFSPWVLSLLLLTGIGNIQELHAMNKMPFPPAYQNFFRLGLVLNRSSLPKRRITLHVFRDTSRRLRLFTRRPRCNTENARRRGGICHSRPARIQLYPPIPLPGDTKERRPFLRRFPCTQPGYLSIKIRQRGRQEKTFSIPTARWKKYATLEPGSDPFNFNRQI